MHIIHTRTDGQSPLLLEEVSRQKQQNPDKFKGRERDLFASVTSLRKLGERERRRGTVVINIV